MRRARLRVLIAMTALVAAAGCAMGPDPAEVGARSALDVPSPVPSPPPSSTDCPVTTFAPLSPMPRPGHMPAGSLRAIQQRGTLIAGVDLHTLVLSYADPATGSLTGFEIDLVRRIAAAIGVRPHFIAVTTAGRYPAVKNGEVDLVVDAATISTSHACDAYYSEPYLSASQRLLVPTSSSARDLADLQGQQICATAGSSTEANLLAHHATVYEVPTRIDCLVALQEGKVAAVSSDDAILAGFVAQDPETKIIGPSLEAEPYGVVIPRTDPDLARFVNGVLEQMRRDGAWQRSFDTWLAKYHAIPDRQPPPTNGST